MRRKTLQRGPAHTVFACFGGVVISRGPWGRRHNERRRHFDVSPASSQLLSLQGGWAVILIYQTSRRVRLCPLLPGHNHTPLIMSCREVEGPDSTRCSFSGERWSRSFSPFLNAERGVSSRFCEPWCQIRSNSPSHTHTHTHTHSHTHTHTHTHVRPRAPQFCICWKRRDGKLRKKQRCAVFL